MTLDGKISSKIGDSTWISNDQSRKIVHKLRSQSDAVLIGVNTFEIIRGFTHFLHSVMIKLSSNSFIF